MSLKLQPDEKIVGTFLDGVNTCTVTVRHETRNDGKVVYECPIYDEDGNDMREDFDCWIGELTESNAIAEAKSYFDIE